MQAGLGEFWGQQGAILSGVWLLGRAGTVAGNIGDRKLLILF